MSFTVAYREGYIKGINDSEQQYSADVDRHIKRWAPDFANFERGYKEGYEQGKRDELTTD